MEHRMHQLLMGETNEQALSAKALVLATSRAADVNEQLINAFEQQAQAERNRFKGWPDHHMWMGDQKAHDYQGKLFYPDRKEHILFLPEDALLRPAIISRYQEQSEWQVKLGNAAWPTITPFYMSELISRLRNELPMSFSEASEHMRRNQRDRELRDKLASGSDFDSDVLNSLEVPSKLHPFVQHLMTKNLQVWFTQQDMSQNAEVLRKILVAEWDKDEASKAGIFMTVQVQNQAIYVIRVMQIVTNGGRENPQWRSFSEFMCLGPVEAVKSINNCWSVPFPEVTTGLHVVLSHTCDEGQHRNKGGIPRFREFFMTFDFRQYFLSKSEMVRENMDRSLISLQAIVKDIADIWQTTHSTFGVNLEKEMAEYCAIASLMSTTTNFGQVAGVPGSFRETFHVLQDYPRILEMVKKRLQNPSNGIGTELYQLLNGFRHSYPQRENKAVSRGIISTEVSFEEWVLVTSLMERISTLVSMSNAGITDSLIPTWTALTGGNSISRREKDRSNFMVEILRDANALQFHGFDGSFVGLLNYMRSKDTAIATEFGQELAKDCPTYTDTLADRLLEVLNHA